MQQAGPTESVRRPLKLLQEHLPSRWLPLMGSPQLLPYTIAGGLLNVSVYVCTLEAYAMCPLSGTTTD